MDQKWATFEDQVRGIAGLVWRKQCAATRLSGVNFDGVIKLNDQEIVVIECTVRKDLNKVREDITKVNVARLAYASNGIVLRGFVVLNFEPTQAMVDAGKDSFVTVVSVHALAALFFEFERYKDARLESAFGSAIDPLTGQIDTTAYVPVTYKIESTGKDVSIERICEHLLRGQNVILLGEYGSGKSRCIRQIFDALSREWGTTFQFPFAINLRECWGLKTGRELIRRAMQNISLDDIEAAAVRVLNSGSAILLFDGFDEIGSQSWSTDENRLKQLRAQALSGVRDAISVAGGGCLIAGREHYFSSHKEMFQALGVNSSETLVIRAKDEFSEEEMESYFQAAGVDLSLPSWLPRRPLICQTIVSLNESEFDTMFGNDGNDATFWDKFIRVLCERDARINSYFDADTIYQVFLALARHTRRLSANVGPISQRTLQEAFEDVVGKLPVEEASVMLLRLPSLGRVGLESSDRQFVDMFILDGLRAKDIVRALDGNVQGRAKVINDQWNNPLEALGQNVLALEMGSRSNSFVQLCKDSSLGKNATLACDIIASSARLPNTIDFMGLNVKGGAISILDFSSERIGGFALEECIVDHLVLPSSPPENVLLKSTIVSRIFGASSYSGLPSWMVATEVDRFDSVQTVAEIRKAGLSPSQEVLVAILKKTFLQKGAGRKEDALLRGFGSGSIKSISQKVVALLMRESFLTRHKGQEGWVYSPERSKAHRVKLMLEQLKSSNDEIWAMATAFDK